MKQLTLVLFLLPGIITLAYTQTPNNRKVENLQAFAKLCGYVRYFHPSDEAANINWNGFTIYGSGVVADAPTDNELLIRLRKLFEPIAPSMKLYMAGEKVTVDVTPPSTDNYKVIAWQHFGVDVGNSPSTYKSVRINRPVKVLSAATNSFAPISQSIDATPYLGKKVKVKAWMKVISNEGSGTGHLWLRVDKKNSMGFFYNMADRPATESEWKEYEFEGSIDNDGAVINIGAFLQGSGTLFIDKIELLVKEGDQWLPVPVKNNSFEEFTSVFDSWAWNSNINNLYKLTANNADYKDGKQSLVISSEVVDANKGEEVKMNTPLFDKYPTVGEYLQKPISKKIMAAVPLALYGTTTETFPVGDKILLQDLKNHISNAVKQNTTGDSLNVRLADVIISWNIFKHFFPYWEDASKTPDDILKDALSKALDDKSAFDFLTTLRLMTAPLNDGHIWVSHASDVSKFSVPLLIVFAENKLVVEKVLDSSIKAQLQPGDVITEIDGVPAKKVWDQTCSYMSGSVQWKTSKAQTQVLLGKQNSDVQLKLLRDGRSMLVTLKRTTWTYDISKSLNLRQKSGFVKEGIYYVDLNLLPMDSIKRHMADLKSAKGIIFDLRGYPNSNHEVINYLLREKDTTNWMFVPEIAYPDFEKVDYKGLGWSPVPDANHLSSKVVFLTDGRAISYAESFMGHIKDLKLATIVGQPTAGTNGNVNPFNLPGGYRISWTGMLVKNHDGTKHHLKGVQPDIWVAPTIKGIKEGRDEFLEKAISVINN